MVRMSPVASRPTAKKVKIPLAFIDRAPETARPVSVNQLHHGRENGLSSTIYKSVSKTVVNT